MKIVKKVLANISPILVFIALFALIELALTIFEVPKFVMAKPSQSFHFQVSMNLKKLSLLILPQLHHLIYLYYMLFV